MSFLQEFHQTLYLALITIICWIIIHFLTYYNLFYCGIVMDFPGLPILNLKDTSQHQSLKALPMASSLIDANTQLKVLPEQCGHTLQSILRSRSVPFPPEKNQIQRNQYVHAKIMIRHVFDNITISYSNTTTPPSLARTKWTLSSGKHLYTSPRHEAVEPINTTERFLLPSIFVFWKFSKQSAKLYTYGP